MATTTRPITELDFDQLKYDIIAFAKTNPAFSDYNFEGSALNSIIDILAYNTHTNAFYANMIHNEGFLDTAQKRSSVVSRAKELGYTPRSSVCSTAFLDVSILNVASEITTMSLHRGTTFTSVNDNGAYSFIVVDTHTSSRFGNDQIFKSVKVVNGVIAKNFFTVDPQTNIRSIFTIPNSNIDTTTIRVTVRDAISSVDYTEYFLATNAYGLKSNSLAFFLQESYNGNYQIYFGGNVIGKQPTTGSIIEIDYIVNENFNKSDGCRFFGFDGSFGAYNSINISTTQVSFGGNVKEAIESIKHNAVKSNSAKERTVTASDYELIIKQKFNFVNSVSVWGGENNVPPVYGKVFLSLQPTSGYTISESVKKNVITPVIRATSPMTISLEFVDPDYLNIFFNTVVKFNPTKSIFTRFDISQKIKSVLVSYIGTLTEFNKDYMGSYASTSLMAIDPGIISVNVSKRVGFKFSPLVGVVTTCIRSVNNKIVLGSIRSTKFVVNNGSGVISALIQEIPNNTIMVSGVRHQSLGLYSDMGFIVDIGYVNLETGVFNFTLNIYSYFTSTRSISIMCSLVNSDILTYRNTILNLDSSPEDSNIGLPNNNIVTVDIYGK